MRIFVYEHLTGGGLLGDAAPPASLMGEGLAMLTAVTQDFVAAGHEVRVLVDARLIDDKFAGIPESQVAALRALLAQCEVRRVASAAELVDRFGEFRAVADWSLIIAPESDNCLLNLQARARACGGRLLGVNAALCRLASSKTRTAEFLAAHGIAAPRGVAFAASAINTSQIDSDALHGLRFPLVLKPDDGCGSLGMRTVPTPAAWQEFLMDSTFPLSATRWRLEEFRSGIAASTAVLLGSRESICLPPCFQHLGGESGLAYRGGAVIQDIAVRERAMHLAAQVASACLEFNSEERASLGWLGIDMVLAAPDAHGGTPSDVCVIEINPRLTTSYVGLRRLLSASSPHNLAGGMLALAAGELCELAWGDCAIEFDAHGNVRQIPAPLPDEHRRNKTPT